ncbi:MAG TPA: hypothetical protein VGH23_01590 [Rhizomicrobium sp.]
MAASTHPIKRAILAKLRHAGSASPKEIAEALGPEWQEKRNNARLRHILGRMTRRQLLVRQEAGRYTVAPGYEKEELDARAGTEDRILAFLRERGGVASTGEIHRAVAGHMPNTEERTQENELVTRTLKESFRQDFGYGRWNLNPEELDRLPLLGRWADHRIQVDWRRDKSPFETWQEARADLFLRVGEAFADARGDLGVLEVASRPEVATILDAMTIRAPAVRAQALDDLRADVQAETGLEGYRLGEAVRERKMTALMAHILITFEMGSVELHLAAPVELYTVCAALFGVCPVALSRGEVVFLPVSRNTRSKVPCKTSQGLDLVP